MKPPFYLLFFFICLAHVDAQVIPKDTMLVNKTWQFIGYIRNGKAIDAPEGYRYTLTFDLNGRVKGNATMDYSGRYKMTKGNEIVITNFWVPQDYVKTKPKEEWDWRFKYGDNLGTGSPIPYNITRDVLVMPVRDNVIMVYVLQ